MKPSAPIVLFLYNRPDHSKRTLDALAQNPEARDSELFIFCDGTKATANQEDVKKAEAVRKLAHNENRFASVKVIEQPQNKGLSASILDGVTEIVNSHGRVIVLEDDLQVAKNFLSFMNEALAKYEEAPEVACISGYVYPLKKQFDTAYFLKGADCWGWATWKGKWQQLEKDPAKLKRSLEQNHAIREFNFNDSYPYFSMLNDRLEGKNQSWAILWYASAFLAGHYCLYPPYSLVHNTGNDGSGTHSVSTGRFNTELKETREIVFPAGVGENKEARKEFERFFRSGKQSIVTRAKNKIKRVLKRLLTNQPHYGWSGDYPSWEAAKKKCSGYDDRKIVNKVRDAVLKVKTGEAVYERDSVLFDEIYLFQPVLQALKNSVHENRLHICDFGGSLGSSWFQYRNELKEVNDLKWTVVEQKHFVEIGKKEIAGGPLHFEYTVEDALKGQTNQLLLLSSVLQYIPDARQLIGELLAYRFEYILIDMAAMIDRPTDRITVQVVPPDIYEASYPCRFFNEEKFLQLFAAEYELLNSFTDAIPEPAVLGAERVSWKGYYFKRKNR